MIDEWNGFAVLLANMIEKYVADLDLVALPDPVFAEDKTTNHNTDNVCNENVEMLKAV